MGFWNLWHCHGGICPVLKTATMTQPVGVGQDGRLWTEPTGGSGSNGGVVYLYTTSPQAPAASWDVELTTEGVNTSALVFDSVNHRVTIPAGVHHVAVSAQLSILSGASGNYSVYVKHNGTAKAIGVFNVSDVYTQTINTNLRVLEVTEGDILTMAAACDAGTPAGYASGNMTILVID